MLPDTPFVFDGVPGGRKIADVEDLADQVGGVAHQRFFGFTRLGNFMPLLALSNSATTRGEILCSLAS